jgi:glycosyltransferase domain-containing protein
MNFKNLTIIIPPHNRHDYLDRILEYLAGYEFDIIISDSSEKQYIFKKDYSQVRYYHYPNQSFSQKIDQTLQFVNTKYCMLMAEDDFYVPETIHSCISFLESNEAYSSCQGWYTRFSGGKKKSIFIKLMYLNIFNRDIKSNDALERIRLLLRSYIQLFYSVHKTDNLKQTFQFSNENKISNMFVIELLIALISISNGKHKVINQFYGAREFIPSSVGNTGVNFHTFASSEIYIKDYKMFLTKLSQYVATKTGNNVNIVQNSIEHSINYYLKNTKLNIFQKIKQKFLYYIKAIFLNKTRYRKQWSIMKNYLK